jgi:hypothetical protein
MSGTPDSTLADPQQIIADLQRQLAECRAERDEALAEQDKAQRRLAERTAERDEALEQQAAIAEVLGVINSSPGDLAPVFDAILEKAHSLCGAAHGVLVVREGETWRAVGARGLPEEFAARLRSGFPVAGNPVAEPLLAGAPFVQLADLSRVDHPVTQAGVAAGLRTLVAVALRRDGALLGWIVAARTEMRTFSDKDIATGRSFLTAFIWARGSDSNRESGVCYR